MIDLFNLFIDVILFPMSPDAFTLDTVTTCVVVWIEIYCPSNLYHMTEVTTCVVVWIKIVALMLT